MGQRLDLPPALHTLAERLGEAGFRAGKEQTSTGFADRVRNYSSGRLNVRFVRDRGQWAVEASPNRGRDWYDVDVWSAALSREHPPEDPRPVAEQAGLLGAELPVLLTAVEREPDSLSEALRAEGDWRAARRLGLEPPG